ncbi:hypothetical protein DL96DRAFT_1706857 [Flagelloscypha sp. PMI_526]|nr:hypothetical protein DL96DRAFT_1706857 [Flagelloscypha sp. PMI_526]
MQPIQVTLSSPLRLRSGLLFVLCSLALWYLIPWVVEYISDPPTVFYVESVVPGTPVEKPRILLNLTDMITPCSSHSQWSFTVNPVYRPYAHPTSKVNLYHGTTVEHATKILAAGGPKFMRPEWKAKNTSAGALHPLGGFYLTDSAVAAAQYARRVWRYDVALIKFDWDPSGMNILEFNNDTEASREFYNDYCWYNFDNNKPLRMSLESDMISGPMLYMGGVHPGSWQYAVTSPKGMKGLTVSGILTDVCDTLPPLLPGYVPKEE